MSKQNKNLTGVKRKTDVVNSPFAIAVFFGKFLSLKAKLYLNSSETDSKLFASSTLIEFFSSR